jgi:hypothetical protein
MTKRRSTILRVARDAGAYWRMSGQARSDLAETAPGLYRVLEELAEITKEVPDAEPVPKEPR